MAVTRENSAQFHDSHYQNNNNNNFSNTEDTQRDREGNQNHHYPPELIIDNTENNNNNNQKTSEKLPVSTSATNFKEGVKDISKKMSQDVNKVMENIVRSAEKLKNVATNSTNKNISIHEQHHNFDDENLSPINNNKNHKNNNNITHHAYQNSSDLILEEDGTNLFYGNSTPNKGHHTYRSTNTVLSNENPISSIVNTDNNINNRLDHNLTKNNNTHHAYSNSNPLHNNNTDSNSIHSSTIMGSTLEKHRGTSLGSGHKNSINNKRNLDMTNLDMTSNSKNNLSHNSQSQNQNLINNTSLERVRGGTNQNLVRSSNDRDRDETNAPNIHIRRDEKHEQLRLIFGLPKSMFSKNLLKNRSEKYETGEELYQTSNFAAGGRPSISMCLGG